MYSYVPCMVYKYRFSYINVYTFLSLYIAGHTRIYFCIWNPDNLTYTVTQFVHRETYTYILLHLES